jgi:hypothetical protein
LQLWQWLLKKELGAISQAVALAEARQRLAALRQAAQWFTPQGPAFTVALADQLVQLAGDWHQQLVLQEENTADRLEWFWLAWDVVQWRQELRTEAADWWQAVQEQLVRVGALAWVDQAEAPELQSPVRHEAISRALTLLNALEPMHQPLPLWISQLQKQLLQLGIDSLLEEAPLAEAHIEQALQWLVLAGFVPIGTSAESFITPEALESNESHEVLGYGVAHLQTLNPGLDESKQQPQPSLTIELAQQEGVPPDSVAEAQRQASLFSLGQALLLSGLREQALSVMQTSTRRSEPGRDQPGYPVSPKESGEAPIPTLAAGEGKDSPKERLRELLAALARGFGLQLPAEVSLLDQLLAARQQLNQQQLSATAVEDLLQNEFPISEQAWADALQKVLLVLRLPAA